MIGFGNGGVIWAEQWVPSGVAAIMVASTPFWMTGLEAVLPGGERLSRRVVIGLIIGFGGILLLVWPDVVAGGAAGRAFAAGVWCRCRSPAPAGRSGRRTRGVTRARKTRSVRPRCKWCLAGY
jgi:hypothetical protein